MLKKLIVPVAAAAFCLLVPVASFAASADKPEIDLNGKKIQQTAVVKDGGLYLPLRAVAEGEGFQVEWSAADGGITLKKADFVMRLDTKERKIAVNGYERYMGGEYEAIEGMTYMQEDFFSEFLKLNIDTTGAGETVLLKSAVENAITIATQKEVSDTGTLELNLQYPEITGLKDPKVQEGLNARFKELAMAAKAGGLENEKTMGEDAATRHIKLSTFFNYRVKYNQKGLLSVVFDSYEYSGGAHGMTVRSSYLFDLETGKEYQLKDLFKDNTDYVAKLSEEIKKQLADKKEMLLTPFEAIGEDQDFYIGSSGLTVYFQLYEYFPYAYGIPEFKIDFSALEDVLKPELNFF